MLISRCSVYLLFLNVAIKARLLSNGARVDSVIGVMDVVRKDIILAHTLNSGQIELSDVSSRLCTLCAMCAMCAMCCVLRLVCCMLCGALYMLCVVHVVCCMQDAFTPRKLRPQPKVEMGTPRFFVPLLRLLFHLGGMSELITSPKMRQLLCDTNYDTELHRSAYPAPSNALFVMYVLCILCA